VKGGERVQKDCGLLRREMLSEFVLSLKASTCHFSSSCSTDPPTPL